MQLSPTPKIMRTRTVGLFIAFAVVCLAGCTEQPVPAEHLAHVVLNRVLIYATENADGMLPRDLASTKAATNERIPACHTLAAAIYPALGLRLRLSDPAKTLVVICPADGGGAYHGFLDGHVVFVPYSKR